VIYNHTILNKVRSVAASKIRSESYSILMKEEGTIDDVKMIIIIMMLPKYAIDE
jgi:hypothetical protein